MLAGSLADCRGSALSEPAPSWQLAPRRAPKSLHPISVSVQMTGFVTRVRVGHKTPSKYLALQLPVRAIRAGIRFANRSSVALTRLRGGRGNGGCVGRR